MRFYGIRAFIHLSPSISPFLPFTTFTVPPSALQIAISSLYNMSTTIEKAITSLLQSRHPITLANTLAAYLQLAGFAQSAPEGESPAETTEAAILAFEHALDKHPSPPPLSSRPKRAKSTSKTIATPSYPPSALMKLYTAEVAQLRKEYWTERLGSGNFMRCTCSGCGRTLKYVTEEENSILEAESRKKNIGRKREFSLLLLLVCSDIDAPAVFYQARRRNAWHEGVSLLVTATRLRILMVPLQVPSSCLRDRRGSLFCFGVLDVPTAKRATLVTSVSISIGAISVDLLLCGGGHALFTSLQASRLSIMHAFFL